MRSLCLAGALILALSMVVAAHAEEGDAARISVQSARVGDRFSLHLEVSAPKDAQVEVLPGGESWAGVEVLDTTATDVRDSGTASIHAIDVVAAAFTTGTISFAPQVSITVAGSTATRNLPGVTLRVLSVLTPGEKLELSPIAPPQSIGGAQSPFLVPAIILGSVVAVVLAAMGVAFVALRIRRRGSATPPIPLAGPAPTGLMHVEELLLNDSPVAGYRTMATTVRSVLGERYGIPAPALTTRELQRRMEAAGVDRWQTRLVGGLLEECDAVVYAGYRPVSERLMADLNMAREIVDGPERQEVTA